MYKRLRLIRIIVSVVFLILLTFAIIDTAFGLSPIGHWLMTVQLVPAIIGGAVACIVLWILITVTFGRVYCSSVCPLGTLQDAASRLGHMPVRGRRRRYQYEPPLDTLRYLIPLTVAACLCFGLIWAVEITDPYKTYQRMVVAVARPAAIGTSSIAAAILTFIAIEYVAWRKGRYLCNTVCPAGGLLSLLGRQPIYRVDINTDLCIHCGKCEEVCKAQCINLKDCVVDNSRCVMCMDCTAICPNNAIVVRRGRYRLSTPMMQRLSTNTQCDSSCDNT